MTGERNHEYTTDFGLDQNSEKMRRGITLETPKMNSQNERMSEGRTLVVLGGPCISGTSLVRLSTTASC